MNYAISTGTVSRQFLQEYIHLYLGQKVLTPMRKATESGKKLGNYIGQLSECSIKTGICEVYFDDDSLPVDFDINELKLILKPLVKMTDEDMKYIEIEDREFMVKNFEIGNVMNFTADQFHYLLGKGYDLFGLIEAELAVNEAV